MPLAPIAEEHTAPPGAEAAAPTWDGGPSLLYRLLERMAGRVRFSSRTHRIHLFMELMRPAPGERVLDLGGGDGELGAAIQQATGVRVTVADVAEAPLRAAGARGLPYVLLDHEAPLPFSDEEFDIVFCNSVLEHVTLPKSECLAGRYGRREWRELALERQRRFAAEIRRVCSSYFVQTPHRDFPIDAHTWLPFTNWLSQGSAAALVRVTDRVWVKRCQVADWHLLGTADMRSLFPDAAIHVERWLGLSKSVIAYRTERS